ncbi:MAG TPA: toll/interleukin-1 receptor domain-containing protein [Solirubrobacteraceae bacterium]|nr:toll/interleukin-1 receptor domain-containing protein [Solirubrobacteraceae bacterium]
MTPSATATPKVFISYRRAETAGHAGRLYDAMVARFGESNVFMDVDMQPGVDFVERIRTVVAACHVLLVVIGPEWATTVPGEAQPRIADPEDFVRLEVGTALGRSDVTVIPLLVERASMPSPEDLPENLRPLTRRNALELSDLRWHDDTRRLMEVIEQLLAQAEPAVAAAQPEPAAPVAPTLPAGPAGPTAPVATASALEWLRRHRWTAIATAAALVLLVALLASGGGDDGDAGPVATSPPPPPAAEPAPNSGAAVDARPAGVPADCENKGATKFAKDVAALREWSDCDVGNVGDVNGASLTYLEFADADSAHESYVGSRDFELANDYKPCEQTNIGQSASREAVCLLEKQDGGIEILWHDKDAPLVGVETFDPPTTVQNALDAWSARV